MKNKDIMHDMKQGKFFIVPIEFTDDWYSDDITLIRVILTDVSYWFVNFDKLSCWCKRNSVEIKGMSLTFDRPEQLTEFILKFT